VTKNRSQTGKQRYPAFQGRLIYDTWRGQQRVRSWPRKRGPGKTPQQRLQTQWFKAANELAKRVAPSQQKIAIEATRNTGLYPRDVIIRAMGAGLINVIEQDGTLVTYLQRWWEQMQFSGVIIRPASDVVPGVNVWHLIDWPLPDLDTQGMWSAGNPSRLTVQAGVEVLEVACCVKQTTAGNALLATRIRKNGVTDVAWSQANSSGTVGDHASTGPMVVIAGDYFEVLCFPTLAGNFNAGPLWYAAQILQVA